MKKVVAWALSGLEAERPVTLVNGVPSSFVPLTVNSGPSWWISPVTPVAAIKTASSSLLNGAGSLALWWLSGPASIETPRATRRVRRSAMADMRG